MNQSWTTRQNDICEGLKCIGEEITSFFESALNHYYNERLPNCAYQIAHAAREIDGGLRDIFASKLSKKQLEESFIKRGLKSIFGLEVKTYKGHIASILTALDVDRRDELAEEWAKIATQFAKYAHRRGGWKGSRKFEEFKPYWDRYEKILERLVGSFYALIERIDRLIRIQDIEDDAIGALVNLLKKEYFSNYFFKKVDSLRWFCHLKKLDYLAPEKILFDENGNAYFWNILDYLERVSEQVPQNPEYGKELFDIIENTVQYSSNTRKINNYYIWWYCVKILNNIPSNLIVENLSVEQFKIWLLEWVNPKLSGELTISDIGEKLLGKFLNNGNTIPYAETIIDVITAIRASGEKDAFPKRENAVLMYNSYWILRSFQKYHKEIGTKCSDNVIYGIADKLKRALEYKQRSNYADIKAGSDIFKLKVSRVPIKGLKDGEIGFKKSYYACIVKQYTFGQIKDVDVENNFWALHNIEPKKELKKFSFKTESKKIFISKIKENSFSEIDWQKAENSKKKLNNLFDGLYEDYSQIWFKSLADGGSDHASGAEEVLTIILRDVLLIRCKTKKSEAKPILELFLSDEYRFPIFKKFVLLCLDKYWDDYPDLFEKFVMKTPNFLGMSDCEVELQDLLCSHNKEFSSELLDKLKKLIGDVPEYYQKEGKKLEAYWKYKWFSPLRDNPKFTNMYNKAKKQAEVKDDKPYESDRSTHEMSRVVHKSPLSKEEILSKPIAEFVRFAIEFKGADFWHGAFEGKPDKEGLSGELQAAVKENPKKFIDEIDLFNRQRLYLYVSSMLLGFKSVLNEGKLLPLVGKIFDFSQAYIKQPWFLNEAFKDQRGDSGKGKYIWVIDTIVGLIEDGCRNDKRAFDVKYFPKLEQIFDAILPLLKAEKKIDIQRDAVTYALNTTLGKVIEAYLIFSLRVVRATKNKEDNWGNNKYERFFEKGIEAYIWFGRYLPNIRYLDQKYADKKIKLFSEPTMDNDNWQMSMEGYLAGSYVYDDIYPLMRQHYIRAIENKALEERADKRLVQHIAIGYLRGYELLQEKNKDGQNSLFWEMLDKSAILNKRDRWLEVADFFWSISGRTIRKEDKEDETEVSKDTRKKILDFWEWTVNEQSYVKTKLDSDYTSFLCKMAELTLLLDRIDKKTEKWLMLSAPHIDKHHNSMFFMEYLTEFKDKESIKRIGKIFLKVLEGTTPSFKQEDIQSIVKRLYELGKKDPDVKRDADDICIAYGKQEIYFLRDVWEKHNKTK